MSVPEPAIFDPAPIPTDPAALKAFVDALPEEAGEGGMSREEMQSILADTDGIDPLTGQPLEEVLDPPTPDPAPAKATDPAPEPKKEDPVAGTETPAGAEAAPADPAPKTDPPAAATPEGILTADGKHVIPYDVLAAQRAENKLLRERVAAAEAVAAKPAPAPEPAKPTVVLPSQEDMDAAVAKFEEDYGADGAKPFKMVLDYAKGATAIADAKAAAQAAEIAALQNQVATRAQSETDAEDAKTEKIIDSIPLLSQWLSDAKALDAGDTAKSDAQWRAAVKMDDMLAELPTWADRPVDERLAYVAKVLGGDAQAPGTPETSPTVDPGAAPVLTPEPTLDQAKAVEAAALAKVAAAQLAAVPGSLTHMPSGVPHQSESEKVHSMSSMELLAHAEQLGPEKWEELMARLG